jgi:hypothetical protein
VSEDDYDHGYREGWDDAELFLARRVNGTSWESVPAGGRTPEDVYDRGYEDGWRARMKEARSE